MPLNISYFNLTRVAHCNYVIRYISIIYHTWINEIEFSPSISFSQLSLYPYIDIVTEKISSPHINRSQLPFTIYGYTCVCTKGN